MRNFAFAIVLGFSAFLASCIGSSTGGTTSSGGSASSGTAGTTGSTGSTGSSGGSTGRATTGAGTSGGSSTSSHEDGGTTGSSSGGSTGATGGGTTGARDGGVDGGLAAGAACSNSSDCKSDVCLGSVCCTATCAGEGDGGADGGACEATACAAEGSDAGAGSCVYPVSECDAPACACASGVCTETAASNCSNGTCPVPTKTPCGAYVCNGSTACYAACTVDANCATGNYCNSSGQCVATETAGKACTGNDDCSSAACLGGFCCASACVTDDGGTCGATACASTTGACVYPTSACSAQSCSAGIQTNVAVCANGSCPQATTSSCGSYACSGTACATSCTGTSDCATGNVCVGTKCEPIAGAGLPCTADSECPSGACLGNFCCAASTCITTGACGTNACLTGTGACAYPTTQCGSESCTAGVQTNETFCAAGTCQTATTTPCDAYACGATACNTGCTSNNDCTTGNYCNGSGQCAPLSSAGGACTSGAECPSGQCLGNVCCGSTCIVGSSCGANQCTAGSGDCVYPTSQCSAESCANNLQTNAASCANGSCSTPTQTPCSVYACGATACLTSCTTSSQCLVAGQVCYNAACTQTYSVQGTLTTYVGTGLVLQDNNGDNYLVPAGSTAFTMPTAVASGAPYAISVLTQPSAPTQSCLVTGGGAANNGSGTVGSANVTNIAVTCSTTSFALGGSSFDYTGSGLVLSGTVAGQPFTSTAQQIPGSNPATGNVAFTLGSFPSGSSYNLTITTQPTNPTATCTLTGGVGQITSGAVTSLFVNCSTNSYTISGTVVGLQGSGLELSSGVSGTPSQPPSGGGFTFGPYPSGTTYNVGVTTSPTSPTQGCTVSGGGPGTLTSSDVTGVVVTCTTTNFALGGTAFDYLGSGLSLAGTVAGQPFSTQPVFTGTVGPNLQSFTLGSYPSGSNYSLSISLQPSSPTQTCTLTGAVNGTLSGQITSGDVTTIAISCSTTDFTITGTVTGLAGSGLVLFDQAGNDTPPITVGNPTFSFPGIPSGTVFQVGVLDQPANLTQVCTATNNTGTVGASNPPPVTVNCVTQQYTVGGTVSSYFGSGLVIQDQDDTANTASPAGNAHTGSASFTLDALYPSGTAYSVSVVTQPTSPTENCAITSGPNPGTVTGANITNIGVVCTPVPFSIGGGITGYAGSGLTLLNTDNGDSYTIPAGSTSFSMDVPVDSGQAFNVVVNPSGGQPNAPWQTCGVSNGSQTVGNGPVTNVNIVCNTNPYSLTLNDSNDDYTGSGLTLTDSVSGTSVTLAQGTESQLFETLLSETTYSFSVTAQPSGPSQTCVLSGANGSGILAGTVLGQPITIGFSCGTNPYFLNGFLSGLEGTGLTLVDGVTGDTQVATPANGDWSFQNPLLSGSQYTAAVQSQPQDPWQICTVTQASGTITSASVSAANGPQVACVTKQYTVSGTITGLQGAGSGLDLEDNGGDDVTLDNGGISTTCGGAPCPAGVYGFLFPTQILSEGSYNVTVASNPTDPWQTCTVSSTGTPALGTVSSDSNVTGIAINCTVNSYPVGGSIVGYPASDNTELVLQLNNGNNLKVNAGSSGFTFTGSPLPSNTPFTVTVGTEPANTPWESCTVSGGNGSSNDGTGEITSGPDNSVVVTCAPNAYSIGGEVESYTGSGLQLQNTLPDGGLDLIPVANASGANVSFTFDTLVDSDSSYGVVVASQPSNPTQVCSVELGGGVVGGSNVTGIGINCSTTNFNLGFANGNITNLLGSSGATLSLSINGSVVGSPVLTSSAGASLGSFPSGSTYAVSVAAGGQPTSPWQTCTIGGGNNAGGLGAGTGTIGGQDDNSLTLSCVTNEYDIEGLVYGLAGTGLQLTNNSSGTPTLSVNASGSSPFAFDFGSGDTNPIDQIASGSSYNVSVVSQPTDPWQTCTADGGNTGVVQGADVTAIPIYCTTNDYNVGGQITGLSGAGLTLEDTDGVTQSFASPSAGATNFGFAAQVASGATYDTTVNGNPTNPWETCCFGGAPSVVGGSNGCNGTASTSISGEVASADISNLLTCGLDYYPITTTITVNGGAYTGSLVLSLQGVSSGALSSGTSSYTWTAAALQTAAVAGSGQSYSNIQVATQPHGLHGGSCVVTNNLGSGSGFTTDQAITGIAVTCTVL